MNKNKCSIPVIFEKVKDVNEDDKRFTKVKIWLMHLGENFNGSCFDKEVVDKAIPTLSYIPIVGFIEENSLNEADFSDHRYVVTKDKNGAKQKYLGVSYGVVTSSDDNNAHYEKRLCDDGQTRTFLVVEGLIWNMFEDSSDILNKDLVKSHSMELFDDEDSVDGYEDENGIFHFTKFSFRAACILGKDYEPAMINSTIEVQFTMKEFVKNVQSELNNKYSEYIKLKNKIGDDKMPDINFTQTVLSNFEDISAIVKDYEIVKNRWGEDVSRYRAVDIQDNEVIVTDKSDNYRYYGFKFTVNGDKPVVDFSSKIRKKISFADYDNTESVPDSAFDLGDYVSEIENKSFEKVANIEKKVAECESAKADIEKNYNEVKSKYDEYVKAENERINAELAEQKESMFSHFEKLIGDSPEFISLKENSKEMTVDEIETKCSVIFSRKLREGNVNFNKSSGNTITVGINNESDENDSFVETCYGNIPTNR
ncbi:MAG: hypothetical protein NC548_52195 [Lachnospiraceae bacterium]|nr:hypothetical protein [Lachnospiraceae bacterium]